MLVSGAVMSGQSKLALKWGLQHDDVPTYQVLSNTFKPPPLYLIQTRFGMFDEVLNGTSLQTPSSLWSAFSNVTFHYARGVALVARNHVEEAH
eukprot:gene6417-7693_t